MLWPSDRGVRVVIVVATIVGIALSFSRLLGVHGVESSLVLGVVLSPVVAAASAASSSGRSGIKGLQRALGIALRAFFIPVGILALNQLRVRNCEPLLGLSTVALGSGPGLLLAASTGALTGNLIPGRRGVTLAALIPIVSALLGLYSFWSTPAIFVYDHFAGWFPGTLYDEGVHIGIPLLTFRLATLAWAGALALVALRTVGGEPLQRPSLPLALLATALIAAAMTTRAYGPDLAHRSNAESIQEALGRTLRGERCIVHLPRELSPSRARRLVEDCDYRVFRAEDALGVTQDVPVHAYFYRSASEKQRWMGAGRTYIAKPWRAEVHLQLGEWPHRVLAHEIVHVVASNAADGPFRVGGQLGGWMPDPGLIEGIAVAIEWPERDGLDPHQQVHAMMELDRAPALEQVMGLSFLTLPARQAYSSAGSFIRYLLETEGAEVVREAHRTGDIEEATGKSLSELESSWRSHITAQPLPEGAVELAALRFSGSSIFSTTCPHRLARLHGELSSDLAARDTRAAEETCRELLDIEENDLHALVTLPGLRARAGDFDGAEEALANLEGAPPTLLTRAKESIADARWRRGDRQAALETYLGLLEEPQTEGEARQREVKVEGIRRGGAQGRAIRALLVAGSEPLDATTIMHLAEEIDDAAEDGLGAYLVARQLIAQERFDLATEPLERARRQGLPTQRIRDEALRLNGVIRFARGDLPLARELFEEAQTRPRIRHDAEDWLARIAYVERQTQ